MSRWCQAVCQKTYGPEVYRALCITWSLGYLDGTRAVDKGYNTWVGPSCGLWVTLWWHTEQLWFVSWHQPKSHGTQTQIPVSKQHTAPARLLDHHQRKMLIERSWYIWDILCSRWICMSDCRFFFVLWWQNGQSMYCGVSRSRSRGVT